MKSYTVYEFLTLLLYISIIITIFYISSISFNPLYFIGIFLTTIGIIQDSKAKYLPRIIINTLAVISVIFIFFTSFNITALFYFAKNIVITFLGIKSLEKKQPRDIYQILILETMGISLAGISNSNISFFFILIIWVFLSIWIFLTTNIYKHIQQERINIYHIKIMASAVSVISFSTVITGLFIFLMMPRIQYPIFNIGGIGGIVNTVGFSNNLSPATATDVLENTATVFRIFNVKGDINPTNTYFIGESLDYFNGISWMHKHRARGSTSIFGKKVEYSIMIEPSYDNVLFGALFPYRVFIYKSPIKAYITSDFTIKTDKPILHRLVYRVYSYNNDKYKQELINTNRFLQLPDNIDPSVIRLADVLKKQNKNPIEAVKEYFKQEHFKYSLSNPNSKHFLYDFLFKYKTGNCEAYASSTAILLRLMGVPARVVVGFHGAFYNKDGNYYFVTNSLAHSWVEAYYNGYWELVDTTPPAYTKDIPKLSKLRMFFDYINYLWDINVVYYSQARQKYLFEKSINYIKTFIKQDTKYVLYILILSFFLYVAFRKILILFSIKAMYKDLCKRLRKFSDKELCHPEVLPDFIVKNGFGDFFYFYVKAIYSKEGISKKEFKFARQYYKKTLKILKASSKLNSLKPLS